MVKVGLGLPIAEPARLLDWARRADAGPFTTLGLLDRVVYDNPEPLVTLAAIAGATTRIRVQTEVLLAPTREPVLLAKQCATLDRLSGGRFTLGIGVGPREEDYQATGTEFGRRGRLLDEQLGLLRQLWAGEPVSADLGPVGPAPVRASGPEILFGAFRPAALARIARWGDGFLNAAPLSSWGPELFRTVEGLWAEAGRAGRPRLVAQVNAALGSDDTVADATKAIGDYYGDYASQVIPEMVTTPDAVRHAVDAWTELGADEVMLYCWASDPDQVDRFADALG